MSERTPNLARTQEGVVAEIKWLAKRGDPLNISAVKRSHPKLLEVVFSVRPFWGWRQALEDAGLGYGKIRIELTETVECRVCGKRQLRLQHHIGSAHDLTSEAYLRRYPSASINAERWQAETYPLTTGIPDFPHWEPIWTLEYVLDRLHLMHARGMPLHSTAIQKSEAALLQTAVRFFGTWDAALELAGVPVDGTRLRQPSGKYGTPDSVLEAVRSRMQAGIPPAAKFVLDGEHEDKSLYVGSVRHFGGWLKVLKAIGVTYQPARRKSAYQTRDEVLAAIRKRHAEGLPLVGATLRTGKCVDWSLYGAAERLFGNWADAVHVALPELPLMPRRRRGETATPGAVQVAQQAVQLPKQALVPPAVGRPPQVVMPQPPLLPFRWREGLSGPKPASGRQAGQDRKLPGNLPASMPQSSPLSRQRHEKTASTKAVSAEPVQLVKQPGIPPAVIKPPRPPSGKTGEAPTSMEDLIRNMGLGD